MPSNKILKSLGLTWKKNKGIDPERIYLSGPNGDYEDWNYATIDGKRYSLWDFDEGIWSEYSYHPNFSLEKLKAVAEQKVLEEIIKRRL